MATAVPPTGEGDAGALLRASAGQVFAALLVGALIWVPVVTIRAGGPWFAERVDQLAVVLGNELGFLVVGLRRHSAWRASSWRRVLVVGIAGALGLLLLGLLYDVLLRLVFGAGTPTIGPWGAARDVGPPARLLIVAIGLVIGPVGEELFFRGEVYGRWAEAGRPRTGAVLSALLFAAARLDPWNLPAYVGMGLLLVAVYRLGESLAASFVAHALTNLAMFTLLFSGYE